MPKHTFIYTRGSVLRKSVRFSVCWHSSEDSSSLEVKVPGLKLIMSDLQCVLRTEWVPVSSVSVADVSPETLRWCLGTSVSVFSTVRHEGLNEK